MRQALSKILPFRLYIIFRPQTRILKTSKKVLFEDENM